MMLQNRGLSYLTPLMLLVYRIALVAVRKNLEALLVDLFSPSYQRRGVRTRAARTSTSAASCTYTLTLEMTSIANKSRNCTRG